MKANGTRYFITKVFPSLLILFFVMAGIIKVDIINTKAYIIFVVITLSNIFGNCPPGNFVVNVVKIPVITPHTSEVL